MPTFDNREKEFEARFKHDQELQFKVKARRNRLLGQWAAEKMGLSGDAAELSGEYVQDEKVRAPSAQAQDEMLAEGLWARSAELVGLPG